MSLNIAENSYLNDESGNGVENPTDRAENIKITEAFNLQWQEQGSNLLFIHKH